MTRLLRSWMFVPGNVERFLDKSRNSDADAVLLDLEDGVLPTAKEDARQMIRNHLGTQTPSGPEMYVRINAIDSPWFLEDLRAIVRPGLAGICIPKVRDHTAVVVTSQILTLLERENGMDNGSITIVAAIEDARGLLNAPHIARGDPRVAGLMFGAEDFALDIGLGAIREGESRHLIHPRSSIVVAARAADILSIDGVHPDLDDEEGLRSDCLMARELGFDAKSTFNPRQLATIQEIFSPTAAEMDYASRVVSAFEAAQANGEASIAFGGQLIDLPIVRRAERVLALGSTRAES